MIDSFVTIFPIFAVILIGWAAVRSGLVREETGNGVADFVFVIAIPLMLFRTIATASLPPSPPLQFWFAYFAGLAIVWVIVSVLARRLFGRGAQEAGIIGFTVGQSNLVLLGIPLILRVFGEEGSVPLFLLVAINLPVTLTIATLVIESAEPGESRLRSMLVKLVTNPILIGIGAGFLYRQTGWPIPGPALASLKFIGDAAAPCALFAMGAALSRYGLGGDLRLLTIVVALKILVFPALVYLLAYKVLALPPVWAAVATLLAASPCGVNAYLLAERYRLAAGLASGAIAVSTILSVATTTFWVWLVR
jgi:predicted permease